MASREIRNDVSDAVNTKLDGNLEVKSDAAKSRLENTPMASKAEGDSVEVSDTLPRKRQHSDSKAFSSKGGVEQSYPSLSDKAAMNALDRMALAHAITLDESFEVKQPSYMQGTMEAQVETTVRKAFWDLFRNRIEAVPPDYSQVLSFILDAKETLLSFLSSTSSNSPAKGGESDQAGESKHAHHDLRERIERELSRSWLERQIANNAIDLLHYADIILGFMAELCAPVRDEELEKARSQSDIADKYRIIFETLDRMKVDFANFHIRAVRPMLQRMSHEYERDNFEAYQKAVATSSSSVEQKDAFKNTVAWLQRSSKQLLLEHNSAEPLGSTTSDWIVSPTAVLFNAFVNLIDDVPEDSGNKSSVINKSDRLAEQYASFPETLALDFEHLLACRLRFHDLTLLSAVLVTVMNNPGALRYISHKNTLTAETNSRTENVRTPPASTFGDAGSQNGATTKQKQLLFVDTLKSELDLVINESSTIFSSLPDSKISRDLFVLERLADFLVFRFTRRSEKSKSAKRSKPSEDVNDADDQREAHDGPRTPVPDAPNFFEEEDIDLLRAQIHSLETPNNAVRKLITSRLRRYFISLLEQLYAAPASRPSSAKKASDDAEQKSSQVVKIPAGFQPLAVDVERLAGVYMRLITHNQATFGKDYARLLRNIADEVGLRRKSASADAAAAAREKA